ncbi:hypothetical protein BaRGS_00038406 [Batillaria attramentaria]|uniref:Uncharacterized protein n=1 Tax=Batillaria attramentaria TaxID=370345 RepID=A0ABD0J681_9CAEN
MRVRRRKESVSKHRTHLKSTSACVSKKEMQIPTRGGLILSYAENINTFFAHCSQCKPSFGLDVQHSILNGHYSEMYHGTCSSTNDEGIRNPPCVGQYKLTATTRRSRWFSVYLCDRRSPQHNELTPKIYQRTCRSSKR